MRVGGMTISGALCRLQIASSNANAVAAFTVLKGKALYWLGMLDHIHVMSAQATYWGADHLAALQHWLLAKSKAEKATITLAMLLATILGTTLDVRCFAKVASAAGWNSNDTTALVGKLMQSLALVATVLLVGADLAGK